MQFKVDRLFYPPNLKETLREIIKIKKKFFLNISLRIMF